MILETWGAIVVRGDSRQAVLRRHPIRQDRVFFVWGARVYWAAQTLMLIVGCLSVAQGLGHPVFALPVIVLFAVVLVRELRMGLQIKADDGSVVLRRVFRDVHIAPREVSTLIISHDDMDSTMWGIPWFHCVSAILILKDGRRIWVSGIESKSETVVSRLVEDFLAALPGHRREH